MIHQRDLECVENIWHRYLEQVLLLAMTHLTATRIIAGTIQTIATMFVDKQKGKKKQKNYFIENYLKE